MTYDDVMHNDVMYDSGSSIRVFGYLLILCGLKVSFPCFNKLIILFINKGKKSSLLVNWCITSVLLQ